jgi:hypothetical protein
MKPASRAVTIEVLTQAFSDFGREMRDFVRQEIHASETRVKAEILDGVADIIDNGIHPQLDDHEHRLARLETKTLGN